MFIRLIGAWDLCGMFLERFSYRNASRGMGLKMEQKTTRASSAKKGNTMKRKILSIGLVGALGWCFWGGCESEKKFEHDTLSDQNTDLAVSTDDNIPLGPSHIYQAESYTNQSGCVFAENHAGYTGTGFMDYGGNGAYLEWNNVNVAKAGLFKLSFRYASAGGTRPCGVLVNGLDVGNVLFSETGAWTSWATVSIDATLKAGHNTVRVSANTDSGGPNLDKMELQVSGDDTENDSETESETESNTGHESGTDHFPQELVPSSRKILYPGRSTTAVVKTGESFEVWFVADNSSHTVQAVQLRGPYHTVLATHGVEMGNWIYDQTSGNSYNTRIMVAVPESTPADRYDIILKTSAGDEVSTRAVKVIKEYKDIYYIVHMSDAHRWQSGYDPITTLHKVSAVINIANIIDAEMIFETGDSLYCHTGNDGVTADRVNTMFVGMPEIGVHGLHGAHAATFITFGNHDSPKNDYTKDASLAETSEFINKYYGLQSYGFKYGNGRFMGVNSGMGPVPSSQSAAAVSWLGEVGHGNFKLVAGHAGGGAVRSFDTQTGLDLILVGHNHFIAKDNPHLVNDKPIQYVANSLRDTGTGNFEFNLFKVNKKTGSYEVIGGTSSRVRVIQNHTVENIADPVTWIPNLTLTYDKKNGGGTRANKATIVNRYDFPLSGARIRFVMLKGYSYAVSKGNIKQAFDGDKVHIVDVVLDLDANSTTTVDIY